MYFPCQAAYRNQLQLQHQQYQQLLASASLQVPGAFPGHPYVINPAAAAAAQAAAAASQEQYLAAAGLAAAGQPILPLHYYAATGFPAPCYPQPGQLITNGATPPAMPPSGQNANARPKLCLRRAQHIAGGGNLGEVRIVQCLIISQLTAFM